MNDPIKVKIQPNGMAQVYSTGKYPEGWFKGDTVRPVGYGMEFHVPVLPKLIVERVHPNAIIPTYASEGDSGMDVYAVEDVTIYPGETVLCPLGFKLGIPRHPLHDLGYRWEVQVRPRSGVSLKTTIRVPNAPGTVDNFFTDEVKVILYNAVATEYELNVEKTSVDDERVVDSVSLETVYSSDVKQIDGSDGCGYSHKGTINVRKGDRIAQLVLNQIIRPLEIVEGKVDNSVSRGGGFGHTGVSWDEPPMGAPKGW